MHWLLFAALLWAAFDPPAPVPADRQPSLAADGSQAALAFGNGTTVWVEASANAGRSFSPPVKVAAVPALMLGRHRGPKIAIAGNAIIVTAISAGSGGGSGDLLAWRSYDRGVSWRGPVTVNDEPRAAREGLHTIASKVDGTVAVAWLDLRTSGTKLYGAYSRDGGATWSKNVLLYAAPGGTICQCCHPSVAAVGHGGFVVMFRNVAGGMRDLYALRWVPGQSPASPQKMGTGNWALDICPMDGGGIAQHGGNLVSAWRREHAVILASDSNSETVLGEGKDVALTDSPAGPYVAWTNAAGALELHSPGAAAPRTLDTSGAFATLASLPDGRALAAWEHDGAIRTAVVDAGDSTGH